MSGSRRVSAVTALTGPVRVFQIALTLFFGRMVLAALAADEVSQNELTCSRSRHSPQVTPIVKVTGL